MKNGNIFKTLMLACFVGSSLSAIGQSTTFDYTGAPQTYIVPSGVYHLAVDVKGAKGGKPDAALPTSANPGCGGRVQAIMAVTPGQFLTIKVGDVGMDGVCCVCNPAYNGGGIAIASGSGPSYIGGGVGGKTDISSGGTTLIVAGGGGGAGFNGTCSPGGQDGGNGGGLVADSILTCDSWLATFGITVLVHAGGGTQTSGGPGGHEIGPGSYTDGSPGTFGYGGSNNSGGGIGGGGGAGYYGGGGGCWTGGGGGSSYTHPSVTSVVHTIGGNCAAGQAVLCAIPGYISGPSSVCEGSTITLNAMDATGGTWSCSGSAGVSSTGVVTGISAGIAQISYSISSSCGSAYAIATVTVNPLPAPISGATNLCVGNTITLSDATPSGSWYSYLPPVATVGLSTGIVTGISTGATTIDYTLSTGCMATTTVNVTCGVGVPQTTESDYNAVSLFPTPATNELTIETQPGAYSKATITNSIGQVLQHIDISDIETKVDLRTLPSGLYLIVLKGVNGTVTRRFIKTD